MPNTNSRVPAAERLGVDSAYYLAARRRTVRNLALGLGLGLLGGIVVLGIVQTRQPAGRALPWWAWLTIIVLPIAVAVPTAVLSWRRVTRSATFREVASVGPYGTVTNVRKTLLRREPLRDEQRPAAQALVNAVQRQTRRWWLYSAAGAIWIALAVFSDRTWERWFRLALGLGYLGLTIWLWTSQRRLVKRAAEQGLFPEPHQTRQPRRQR